MHVVSILALIIGFIAPPAPALAGETPVPIRNGFRLAPADIPIDQILQGGPPRDGIRALENPEAIPTEKAAWDNDEFVIGVVQGQHARAYPIAILRWHELVNDTLGDQPILVSFCPLCGTALVFDRKAGNSVRTFGVSGLLYQSDLLLFDRESESLWSQILSEAVSGPQTGVRLRVLRSSMMRWEDWKKRHPDSSVLSRRTRYPRPYARDPYSGYALKPNLMFPAPLDERYHSKMPTLGIRLPHGQARAYPAVELVRAGGEVREDFEGHPIRVRYDPERQVFEIDAAAEIEVIEGFWFAWAAFHPKTSVFVADAD